VSSLDIEIFVLLRSFKNLLLFKVISCPSNSSAKEGKLSVGKHKRLKSEFSLFRLSLFSDFKSKLNSELEEIFLSMSYSTPAEVVVLPSFITLTSVI
jgi:hypothetical protein